MALPVQSHAIQRGGLPHIPDLALIGHSEYENVRPFYALCLFIERLSDLLHDKLRHLAIHFARQLNEPRPIIQGSQLPSKIMGIYRSALTSQPRPTVKRPKTKSLVVCPP